MGYVKIDVKKPAKGGSSQGKKAEIVIIDADDLASFPNPDDKGIVLDGDMVFKPGKYAIKIDATVSTISLPVTSEGEEDAVSFTGLPEFYHPGDSLEKDEFVQAMTNKNLIVGVKIGSCSSGNPYYKMFGRPCNPLSLLVELQDNNEATKTMIKFQQFSKSDSLPGRYYGTITFDTANVVDPDTSDIDVAAGTGEYQLGDNTAASAINAISNPVHNGVYTLLGGGGANPSTLAASVAEFHLKDGTDWQGLAGSKLTLKAYKNGPTSFCFFELSRS